MRQLYFRGNILFILQSASKEHSARVVDIVVTVTLVFVAIRSAATAFVRKGGLGTNVTKVLFTNTLRRFLRPSFNSNNCSKSKKFIEHLVFDLTVCPEGSYGSRCAQRCRCFENAHCDPVEGACQCPAGRTGKYCQKGKFVFITKKSLICTVNVWLENEKS